MKGTPYRHAASFGKRHEYIAIAELLRRGYDVYMTLVDDQHIDCVVRLGKSRYLDIQIKARSSACQQRDAGRFAAMSIPKPRENYYFIFYSEQADTYWVLPSKDLVMLASRNREGKNKGKYHINLTGKSKRRGGVYPLDRFAEYIGAFDLLRT